MACQFAKRTRQPEGVVNKIIKPEKDGGLKKENLAPGTMVSSDQFVSSLPGRLPNTYGCKYKSNWYNGRTIFIDDASGFIALECQVSLGAAETLRAKHKFERDLA